MTKWRDLREVSVSRVEERRGWLGSQREEAEPPDMRSWHREPSLKEPK